VSPPPSSSAARQIWQALLLLAATATSFALQNSPLAATFATVLAAPAGVLHLDIRGLVNDGLMAVFFLVVGLELKRETLEGPFRNPRLAALPIAGALGGMIAPALVFLAAAVPAGAGYARGWAIPAATDIAFALAVLRVASPKAPASLRLFLLALAVADDLGAILIIACFYAGALSLPALAGAAAVFGLMLGLNRAKVGALWPYWLFGLVLWALVHASGVHATIAGVLTAFAVPMRRQNGQSPLIAAEGVLTHWAGWAVLPLFALANAGAALDGGLATALHPVALAAAAGLVIGKPLGIFAATVLAGLALRRKPPSPPLALLGLSMIAGVGFTMSLFIGGLAFGAGPLAAPVRLGVLIGSAISAIAGGLVLRFALRRRPETAPQTE
jgi:Na+:H+ antiporter, NhaA family